jgi:hypothetical protein
MPDSNIGITNAQVPKNINNVNILQPWDPTASGFSAKGQRIGPPSNDWEGYKAQTLEFSWGIGTWERFTKTSGLATRRRSFHSSARSCAKGIQPKSSPPNRPISDEKSRRGPQAPKRASKPITIGMWAKEEVSKCLRNPDRGLYHGLINIISNPHFLWACYETIRGKPGNMTKVISNETLDGIKWSWFENLAATLKKGKYNFKPARRILIPKPGKPEKRPLGIGNPREKIVQKAGPLRGACSALRAPLWWRSCKQSEKNSSSKTPTDSARKNPFNKHFINFTGKEDPMHESSRETFPNVSTKFHTKS